MSLRFGGANMSGLRKHLIGGGERFWEDFVDKFGGILKLVWKFAVDFSFL
jgi:hypothetical protein